LAQARKPRIGMLSARPLKGSVGATALLEALSKLGYRSGTTMSLEYRSADGVEDRYPALARELMGLKCDLIFALPAEAIARALRDAGSAVPVVFLAFEYDPLESGIVKSLSRPGGHMTGVSMPLAQLTAKQLEIAQETLPSATRILVFSDQNSKYQLEVLKRGAAVKSARLTVVEYTKPPYDFVAGFETGRREKVDLVIGLLSPEFANRRTELDKLYARYAIPAFVPYTSVVETGILISYTTNISKLWQRAAQIGAQILKGAKPGDIPVEQPSEFDLIVNLKTARALGIKVPYSVLSRATKVVE
jgi:putative ABC transport system substrate-binding protein